MTLKTVIGRKAKFWACYFQNWWNDEKNMLNETRRPAMCQTCPNILGRDVTMLQNGICDRCKTPAKVLAKDETERVLRSAFFGQSKDRVVERHRAEKAMNDAKNKHVVKTNKELLAEADKIKNMPL